MSDLTTGSINVFNARGVKTLGKTVRSLNFSNMSDADLVYLGVNIVNNIDIFTFKIQTHINKLIAAIPDNRDASDVAWELNYCAGVISNDLIEIKNEFDGRINGNADIARECIDKVQDCCFEQCEEIGNIINGCITNSCGVSIVSEDNLYYIGSVYDRIVTDIITLLWDDSYMVYSEIYNKLVYIAQYLGGKIRNIELPDIEID